MVQCGVAGAWSTICILFRLQQLLLVENARRTTDCLSESVVQIVHAYCRIFCIVPAPSWSPNLSSSLVEKKKMTDENSNKALGVPWIRRSRYASGGSTLLTTGSIALVMLADPSGSLLDVSPNRAILVCAKDVYVVLIC